MKTVIVLFSLLMLMAAPTSSDAIPVLQIYLEGATYDSASETWVLDSSSESFTLWVIGDVSHYGTIYDVRLAAAVATSEVSGSSIALTPSAASGIDDPSIPGAPEYLGLSADGAVPILGNGSLLPTHEIYGSGVSFFEWNLGTLSLTDSPIGDFIDSYPLDFPDEGQINAYTVAAAGFSSIHFDVYDHIAGGNRAKYKFAPFSHDGEGNQVPEPDTFLLLGAALLGLGWFSWKHQNK